MYLRLAQITRHENHVMLCEENEKLILQLEWLCRGRAYSSLQTSCTCPGAYVLEQEEQHWRWFLPPLPGFGRGRLDGSYNEYLHGV